MSKKLSIFDIDRNKRLCRKPDIRCCENCEYVILHEVPAEQFLTCACSKKVIKNWMNNTWFTGDNCTENQAWGCEFFKFAKPFKIIIN